MQPLLKLLEALPAFQQFPGHRLKRFVGSQALNHFRLLPFAELSRFHQTLGDLGRFRFEPLQLRELCTENITDPL